jgi:hypothetical protein
VTFAPGGNSISETQQILTLSELPQPVLDWFRQNFPGAAIDEAELTIDAGPQVYDVRVVTPDGKQIETRLLVQGADQRRAVVAINEETGIDSASAKTMANHRTDAAAFANKAIDTVSVRMQLETVESLKSAAVGPAKQADAALVAAREPCTLAQAEATSAFAQTNRDLFAQAFEASEAMPAATVGTVEWLPHVVGVIRDISPIDVSALEQGLRQVLDNIDALAERVAGDAGNGTVTWGVILVSATVMGTQFVIFESRKRKREPQMVISAASSTWSWVLGAAATKRPQQK